MAKSKKKARRSRAIVCGFLEKVNARIFDKYRGEITDMIRGHQGVYALYRKNKLYYVGLAGNLRNRIKQHLRDRHQGKWTHFSLYIIRKADHIKELESLVLRIADPPGTSIKGRLRTTNNLLPKLKAQVKKKIKEEYEGLFKSQKKAGGGGKAKTAKKREKKSKGGRDLPLRNLLRHYQPIYATYKENRYKANVCKSGWIKLNGKLYSTPSGAAKAIVDRRTVNGWGFWKYKDKSGGLVALSNLKK